jgi:hypothetical protein
MREACKRLVKVSEKLQEHLAADGHYDDPWCEPVWDEHVADLVQEIGQARLQLLKLSLGLDVGDPPLRSVKLNVGNGLTGRVDSWVACAIRLTEEIAQGVADLNRRRDAQMRKRSDLLWLLGLLALAVEILLPLSQTIERPRPAAGNVVPLRKPRRRKPSL